MPQLVSFTGVAHPWMCDAMGHVNVRHYAAMFDDAGFQLLGHVVGTEQGPLGWADVRIETDFLHETAAGALLTVRSHVLRVGRSSLTYMHVMSGSLDQIVRARATVTSVRFDLSARKSVTLDDAARGRAEALIST